MHFRYDINALRAIAVISVVIFHFYPQILTGGFAGVDVFFVISGFLMTGIIMRGFEKENFNLIQFYIARCNRIIPALAVLCFVLIILGWFILLPTEYKDLGKHVASSITFISNMIYWRESGYFDTSSLTKWLLHTWSLSVEWQFYMLYPIYLMILKKIFNIKLLPIVIYTTFILSLTIGIYLTSKAPSFAYFSLFGRAWELLLGGCVYFIAQNKTYKNNLFYLGITLIIASSFFIDSSMQWPGYLALIPTLGAALVLLSNNQNSYLVQNSLVQKLGLYSYSIYLWHWPIVVFLHYFNLTEYSILGIIFSIFLGYLSYTYIESWKITKLHFDSFSLKFISIYMSFTITILGICIYTTKGMPFRMDYKVIVAETERENINKNGCIVNSDNPESKIPSCYLGNNNSVDIILIGDSHAYSTATALATSTNNTNGLLVMSRGACPFFINMLQTNNTLDTPCLKDNKLRFDFLTKIHNTPIVLAGRWEWYLSGETDKNRKNIPPMYFTGSYKERLNQLKTELTQTIMEIKKTGKTMIYIVLPIPEMEVNIPNAVAKRLQHNDSELIKISKQQYLYRANNIRNMFFELAQKFNLILLDPSEFLCDENFCYAEHKDRPIYYDNDHLSEYGNKLLIPMFERIVLPQPESSNHSDQGYESHE